MSTKEGIIKQMQSLRDSIQSFGKRKSVRYGVPFLLFVVGGSFGLKEWTQIR